MGKLGRRRRNNRFKLLGKMRTQSVRTVSVKIKVAGFIEVMAVSKYDHQQKKTMTNDFLAVF